MLSRRAVLALVLLLAACASPLRAVGPLVPPETRVTLLQINDVYTLDPVDGGRRGGFARLATLVQRLRAENQATLFALAGDTISPSVASMLLQGEQMIAGLNAVGLDVATFGNHEFDFGPDVLRARMRESTFAWTSANVLDRRSGQPFGGAAPAIVLTLAGVRVGLFGLTTAEAARSSSPGADVEFRDPLATAREVSARLRADGAQLVVALTHQHMSADRELAATADVDVVLGGHEHDPLIAEAGRALITKAGADARYLVQVDLWFGGDGKLRERSWTFHEVSARLPDEPRLAALAREYRERVGHALDVEIGRTTAPLEGRRSALRTAESNLADFVADAMRARLGTDVALINGGAIRSERVVPPGPLTRREVAEMLPFGDIVVTLEVTGAVLRQALEQGMRRLEHEGGGFLQVSGLTLTFDPAKPAGQRIVSLTLSGAPLDPTRRYTIATVDYVARGGDTITALHDAKVLTDASTGPLLADVVIQSITSHGTIAPQPDGRIRRLAP